MYILHAVYPSSSGHLGCFHLWAAENKHLCTWLSKYCSENLLLILDVLRNVIDKSHGNFVFSFVGTMILLSSQLHHFIRFHISPHST